MNFSTVVGWGTFVPSMQLNHFWQFYVPWAKLCRNSMTNFIDSLGNSTCSDTKRISYKVNEYPLNNIGYSNFFHMKVHSSLAMHDLAQYMVAAL